MAAQLCTLVMHYQTSSPTNRLACSNQRNKAKSMPSRSSRLTLTEMPVATSMCASSQSFLLLSHSNILTFRFILRTMSSPRSLASRDQVDSVIWPISITLILSKSTCCQLRSCRSILLSELRIQSIRRCFIIKAASSRSLQILEKNGRVPLTWRNTISGEILSWLANCWTLHSQTRRRYLKLRAPSRMASLMQYLLKSEQID